MTVGQNIRNRRKQLGMSVDELATKVGKNRATIFRYESGKIESVPSDTLKLFAEALCTTPESLMSWEKSESSSSNVPSRAEKELFELFNQVPPDQQEMVLSMIRAALGKK